MLHAEESKLERYLYYSCCALSSLDAFIFCHCERDATIPVPTSSSPRPSKKKKKKEKNNAGVEARESHNIRSQSEIALMPVASLIGL